MNTVKQDRAELKRLVESYGKKDVLTFVNHINEHRDSMHDIKKARKADYDRIAQECIQDADEYLIRLCELLDSDISLKDEKRLRYSSPGRFYFDYNYTPNNYALWYARTVCDKIGSLYQQARHIKSGYIYAEPEIIQIRMDEARKYIEKYLDPAEYEEFKDRLQSEPGKWTDGYGHYM